MFVLQAIHFLDALEKTLTEIFIKNFKSFVASKNKKDLIKALKTKCEYVRISEILAKVSTNFALGKKALNGTLCNGLSLLYAS